MRLTSIFPARRCAIAVPVVVLLTALAGCQAPSLDEQDQAREQAQQAARDAATPVPESAVNAPPVGNCDASQVQGLVGTTFNEAEGDQAMADANAKQLRVLTPNDAATMDFIGERLNIELDEQRVVTAVRCG